ncbi:MAG TPA: ATP-dependent Clp protease ATP-binding subunit [Aggregatilineales bacterium]|nr:ATP-dependent Clp protease ATP-binding subunit [Anaerolineales bacterium]HRE46826.1 ATP-dependent Clp protease ATP-binding subunit [Aggregatilineales bacterium]
MATLNPKLLSNDTNAVLNAAIDIVKSYSRSTIYPEAVLLALIRSKETAARRLLDYFHTQRGLDMDRLERSVRAAVEQRRDMDGDLIYQAANGTKLSLSRQMIIALDEALSIAQAGNEVYIDTDHLLATLTESKISTGGLLRGFGITPKAMTDLMADRVVSKKATTAGDVVEQVKKGDARAVYFRKALLDEVISMLSQRIRRNVLLIGADGVGKRSLVYSLGLLMAEGKGPVGLTKLVTVEEGALLDNASGAITSGIAQAKGGILFIPRIERFFGGPVKAEFPKATPLIQKAILGSDPVIIGTATQADYDERLVNASGFGDHVQFLRIPEPSEDEAAEILKVIAPHIASDYKVGIMDEAIKMAVKLAKRYMSPGVPLPRSAEHLLHRAAAMVNVSRHGGEDAGEKKTAVDGEDVTLAAAQITGIPVAKLGQDERTRYASMVEHIHERIIGQEEAVLAVSRAVKTARVGLKDPKRPIGSFMFLGPTGVGKTELAKALSEFMFNSEDALLEIDMSEYMDESAVNKLIGAPPGYVGFEGGGQLTDRVRLQPYTVVLFDEVEKANPRVMDVLLQVMEAGRLTDGQGRPANFSETVIILTSNLGHEYLQDTTITEEDREGVMEEVRGFFRPEFLNRLDEIVIFSPLNETELRQILDLMLKKEIKMAGERGLKLEFTPTSKDWMMAQNDHPEWGARPLRRIIARSVREPLADFLLTGNSGGGTTITIDGQPGAEKLTFKTG